MFLSSWRYPSEIPTAGSLLPQKGHRREGFFTHHFPSCQECLYPFSSTSSYQLLLTPAACVYRAVLCLAPVCSCVLCLGPLGCKGSSGASGRPAAFRSDFSLCSGVCVQQIYIYIEGWSSFWVPFVFSILSHKVEGSCSFCNSIRSHFCPEMSLPRINLLIFLSC